MPTTSPITPVGASPTAPEPPGRPVENPGAILDRDAFLKLLVAQLKYQDPTKPVDASQMVAQSAQLTMVDRLNEIASTLDATAASNRWSLAGGLVGKDVTFEDEDGILRIEQVTSVRIDGDDVQLTAGAFTVPLAAVESVHAPVATSNAPIVTTPPVIPAMTAPPVTPPIGDSEAAPPVDSPTGGATTGVPGGSPTGGATTGVPGGSSMGGSATAVAGGSSMDGTSASATEASSTNGTTSSATEASATGGPTVSSADPTSADGIPPETPTGPDLPTSSADALFGPDLSVDAPSGFSLQA